MLVREIRFVSPLEDARDIEDYNIDVFVELENDFTYTMVVGTPKNLIFLMDKDKMNFLESDDPFIIVKKMTKEIIEEAVQAYAADNAYWLKFYHFGEEVNIDVFNQLEFEQIEELKEIDELIKEDLKALGKLDK